MLVNRAYKFRMYPSVKQEELINYNIILSKKKNNSKLTSFDMIKEIPKLYNEYSYLKEIDSCSLRCAIFDLENGLNKYYIKQVKIDLKNKIINKYGSDSSEIWSVEE